MEQVRITITGLSPLLMHRFPMEPVDAIQNKTPHEQASLGLYLDDVGAPCIPGVNVHRALIAGATFSKGKGRGSLQKNASAGLFVDEGALALDPGSSPWVVDSRPVVVPATKGRIVRHRPRFDKWVTSFTVTYDKALLSEQQVRRIVDDTGQRVGLLDFRPEKKGPFGRFVVTNWRPV